MNVAMPEGNLRTFDEKLDGKGASFDERRWTVTALIGVYGKIVLEQIH